MKCLNCGSSGVKKKKIVEFMGLRKGKEVTVIPESKEKLLVVV